MSHRQPLISFLDLLQTVATCVAMTWLFVRTEHLASVDKTTQGVVILHTEQIRELRDQVQGVEFISTDAEPEEPPATTEERAAMAAENYGGPIKRWRENRPKPIQKIVHDAKETTANGAAMTKWIAGACIVSMIGLLLLPVVVMLCRRPQFVVVRPEERKP